MLLRDAQEEARVIYAARQSASNAGINLLKSHLTEVSSILEMIYNTKQLRLKDIIELQKERAVGMILLVGLELANELEVDCLKAIKSVFLEESP